MIVNWNDGNPDERSTPKEYEPAAVFSTGDMPGHSPLSRRSLVGTTLAMIALVQLIPIIVVVICWVVIAGLGEKLSKPGTILWISPERLADFAAFISGPERADDLREEWRCHLAGETGAGLPDDRQIQVATGLMVSAIRYRLQDLADRLGEPVDALLRSRELSGLLVLAPTLWVSVLFIQQGGLYGLADHLEPVAVVWGAAIGLIRLGRKWRDVKPPERKPRRKKG
jgi:hypothetical protein